MKKINCMILGAAALLLCCCVGAPDVNTSAYVPKSKAFTPGKILLDNNGRHVNAHGAGFLYDNGRYYMFGEHKVGGTLGNKSIVGVHCYSSEDLYNWRDEGIVLEMSRDPESPIVIGTIIERPKVIFNQKTGKYVMWFHMESRAGPRAKSTNIDDIIAEKPSYKTGRAGLAVADKITGPYKFVGAYRLNAKKYPMGEESAMKEVRRKLDKDFPEWRNATFSFGKKCKNDAYPQIRFLKYFDEGQTSRDMTLFVDDDLKAYLICASEDNATLHINELSDDYQSLTGHFARVFPLEFNEAPAVFKRDGKYFMLSSHCTGWAPNPLRVAVSDSIYGPWKPLGDRTRGFNVSESDRKVNPVLNKQYWRDAADSQTKDTFKSQSTYVIKVNGKKDAFIYVGDRWTPRDAIDGRYIFLPIEWDCDGLPVIRWYGLWDLSIFDKKQK